MAAIHPYGITKAFALWEIDFAGSYIETSRGNRVIITAIEYITERSAKAAVELLEEIIWTIGKPEEITTDNGEEFRCRVQADLLPMS